MRTSIRQSLLVFFLILPGCSSVPTTPDVGVLKDLSRGNPSFEIVGAPGTFEHRHRETGDSWFYQGTLDVVTTSPILRLVHWEDAYPAYRFGPVGNLPPLYEVVVPAGKPLTSDPVVIELALDQTVEKWVFIELRNTSYTQGAEYAVHHDLFGGQARAFKGVRDLDKDPYAAFVFEQGLKEDLGEPSPQTYLFAHTPQADAALLREGVAKK